MYCIPIRVEIVGMWNENDGKSAGGKRGPKRGRKTNWTRSEEKEEKARKAKKAEDFWKSRMRERKTRQERQRKGGKGQSESRMIDERRRVLCIFNYFAYVLARFHVSFSNFVVCVVDINCNAFMNFCITCRHSLEKEILYSRL